MSDAAPPPSSALTPLQGNPRPTKDVEAKVDDLTRRVRALEAALGALALAKSRTPPPTPRPRVQLKKPADESWTLSDDAKEELDALRAKNKELTERYEEVEGEYQALKLRSENLAQLKGQVDLSELNVADPQVSATIEQLVAENAQLSAELNKHRQSATRKIKRLSLDLDQKQEEVQAVAKQKENLLKELAHRDASAVESPDLTLEQITASPVFKQMLGNIRRTSREEVTLLHDAIVALGKTHPEAYDRVLDVVEETFAAARVENPLALLERSGQ